MKGDLVTTIYRHLLRSASQAVRHDRAATKNIRRLLRDDFEHAAKTSTSEDQLIQHAESSMFLHLAASKAKEDISASNLLAHRTIRNLSSLCYHHLSPHTCMQPNTKKRRVGGTDTAALRRRRGSSGLKSSVPDGASLAMNSFGSGDATTNSGVIPIDVEVLPSLVVTSKPVRGPYTIGSSRRFSPGRWDGQKPVKTIQTSSAFVAHLESMVKSIGEEIEQAKKQYGPYTSQVEVLDTKMKKLKGEVKATVKSRQLIKERQTIQSEAANMLLNLVKRAQVNNGTWLGVQRFQKWATGAWLPP